LRPGAELRFGILIKRGEALQRLEKIDTVVLDKTGTITEGRPQMTDVLLAVHERGDRTRHNIADAESRLLRFAAALEHASEHPLAGAMVRYAEVRGLSLPQAQEFESLTGLGVVGNVEGESTLIGNPALMAKYGGRHGQTADSGGAFCGGG
jgi:Cu+-exporting ATPase